MQKQVSSRKSAKESITRNQAFVVRKNLKPQENVNIINCAQKIPDGSVRDFYHSKENRERDYYNYKEPEAKRVRERKNEFYPDIFKKINEITF